MSSVKYFVKAAYTSDQKAIDDTAKKLAEFGEVSVVAIAPARIYTARDFEDDIFSKDNEYLLSKFLVGKSNRYFNGHGLVDNALASDEQQNDTLCVRPLYMYAHSGVALSHAPFSCPWDSGQVGVHAVFKSDLLKAGFEESALTTAFANEILDSELAFADAFVRGYLYDVTIEDEEGDTVDVFTVDCTRISESLYEHGDTPLSDEQRQAVSEVEKSIENAIRS